MIEVLLKIESALLITMFAGTLIWLCYAGATHSEIEDESEDE